MNIIKNSYQNDDGNEIYDEKMDDKTFYLVTLTDLDTQINNYNDNVDVLWKNVIIAYKNNLNCGIILDKLTANDKAKFYKLMSNTTTIKNINGIRRRLISLISKLK